MTELQTITLRGEDGDWEDSYPLSPLQSWLLFQGLDESAPAVEGEQLTCLLSGDLDTELLHSAWQAVVDRHPALRSLLVWDEMEQPLQIVRSRVTARIETLDGGEPRHGIDLDREPAIHASLIRLGEQQYRLVLTAYPLLVDSGSLALVLDELLELYRAAREGRPARLAAPAPYRDFIAWLERWELDPATAEEAEAFWRETLSGFTEPLALPGEAGEGTGQCEARLSAADTAALRAFAERRGLALDTVIQGSWALLLGRWSGREEVVFGAVVEGRPEELPGAEAMVGLLANTVPVRCALPPTAELISWLNGLQEQRDRGRACEHTLLPRLQAWSELPPGAPLFESLFVFQSLDGSAGGGLAAHAPSLSPRNLYPLQLTALLGDDALSLQLSYDRSRLSPATAERLLERWAGLLGALPECAGRTLAEIADLAASGSQRDETAAGCLHERFIAQARRAPASPALSCEGTTLTYGELDRLSDGLAARLAALGAGPESVVAVCLPRSAELVAALLAVLKTGAAYVPLDPGYPPEHLAWVLADSGARLLVARSETAAMSLEAVRLVAVDGIADLAGEETPSSAPHLAPENLAYIIYTSGSTGRPKGVMVTHANVVRLLAVTAPFFGFGPDDVWTLFHSFAFDFSVWEIWGALAFGGRLVVVPYEVSRSPETFAALLAAERVTVLNQTPSAFAQLAARSAPPPDLRWVIFGGEALEPALVRGWLTEEGRPGPHLANMYGITETTVHVTLRELGRDDLDRGAAAGSPIGRPLADLSVDLLDGSGGRVTAGIAGEMHIGGAGLARGYLGRPELTAERFVPDPWSGLRSAPGSRLYRSGDLARRLAGGELEYAGRADSQVKVRGFRIEPGEIEAALLAEPEVAEAAVVVREPAPGDRRLAAFVVPRTPAAGQAAALRAALRRRLPDHMVPATVTVLAALPLTANGKTDRRSLAALDPESVPEIAPSAPAADGGYAAPRTPAEELFADTWQQVLGKARVGIHDNFFDLGGDSILSLLVVSWVARAGWRITPRQLFDHPTVARLAAVAEFLGEAALEAGEPAADPAPQPIRRLARGGALPLSFAQERLWFLDRLGTDRTAYNINLAMRVHGELSTAACAAALNAAVRRHEALRTTFAEQEGRPVQVIAPPATVAVPLPAVDLTAVSEGCGETEALRLAAALAALPFDLARGPLLRAALLRLAPSEHVLLVALHHIIADGWSLALLMREIAEHLAGADGTRELPEPALQYADFAAWQRQQPADSELEYWRGLLAGIPLRLALPADRSRRSGASPAASDRAGSYSLTLPMPEELNDLARSAGASLFMVELAAFEVLLYRLTGQERLVVGTVVANRPQAEIENVVGLFVNTLPLPADLSGDPTVPALLARVREVTLGAFAHQQLPFEQLVDVLQPERSLEQTPVVQAMLVLQNATRPAFAAGGGGVRVPGLSFEPLPVSSAAAKFDLTLELLATPQGLAASWEYRTRLFEAATVARWAQSYANLLAALPTLPASARISDLDLLSAAERHQLLVEWSGRTSRYPHDLAVHELFAARAAADPGAVALIVPTPDGKGEPVTVTYGDLAARADRLAARLRALGVSPEARVAVCLDRSPELIAALLAVLQAGGAYAPLDPAQPAQRLGAMLEDLRSPLLLTSQRHAPLFTDFVAGGGRLVLLDGPEEELPQPAAADPAPGGDRLAYVMFTSGSTGRPKGVAVPHRAIVRLVCETDYARFGPEEVWLQLAPVSFDASTLEIWGALLHGGRLVLMPPGTPTLGELAAVLSRHRVTSLWLTAGLFHQMVDEDLSTLSPVRQLLAGGEALSPSHVLRVARELPALRLINGYGPTEGTTFSCCWPVGPAEIAGSVPIGRPISNTRALVLDAAGQPAAIGVAGELLIGGDGLARGYLGRPDLTAERFRPHPWSLAGERVYHTGDLLRFLPDGSLDFLGRIDRQIKIRGFRIEPAEIEAALLGLPGVAAAAVVAQSISAGSAGEVRLAAFVVGEEGVDLVPAALRHELRSRLPEAFVPAVVRTLPALPLTANGKVDREALLRLGTEPVRGEDEPAPARDPLEELVAGIWAGVLGLERVGADENFFDLGGHSLRATQVMSRLRQACGVDLPLRLLFEAPTAAGLTDRLRSALAGDEPGLGTWAAIPRRSVPEGAGVPLSFAQERLWFLDQLTPGNPVFNIPGVLALTGSLNVPALAAAFAAVVRRHEALRTVFRAPDGEPAQVVQPPGDIPLPLVDLTALPAAARDAAVVELRHEEEKRGFDLAAGPLFRACLLRLESGATGAPARHLLLLTFHHIAFDGSSTGVLARELAALYDAALAGLPSPLPELPIQYADFACWQRERLTGDTLERFAGYWRQRLAGVPPLRLPLDRPRPALQSYAGEALPMALSPAAAEAVRRTARLQAVTPFMVGLTAFAVLLYRASGQSDFAVGTWVANRNRPEVEGLIGFFINNLALRLDLDGALPFGRLLMQVREAALGAYAHQDMPFEKVVEDLKLPRDLSLPPVFQVVSVQQPPAGRLDLSGVRLELLSAVGARAHFDLTLDLGDPADHPYVGTLVYNRALFDHATVARLGRHFELLLAAALSDETTGTALDELPLLSAAESWQLTGEWSRGLPRPAAERLPGVAFVHQLIERRAALRPAAEAVVWPDAERLSYGELNARANRLARCLRRRGVGPEVRVALWLPRSVDLVVCSLAVLKAGGCYVPLDATYSGERLAFMAADAQARVLVTQTGIDLVAPPAGAAVLLLDDPAFTAELGAESAEDLSPEEIGLAPNHLAYVIYTSGSTGRPKGTMIEHGSLLTAYYAYEQAYRLGDVTAHLQMASFSFDVFTGDLVRALGSGARLVLCPREVLLDPARLHGLMVAERIDGAEFVPAVVRSLVEHLEREGGGLDFMRLLVVSSDAWYAAEVEPLARLCGPRTRLIDSYGVTEATIDTTFLPLAAGDGTPCLPVPAGAAVVPIGRPLADNEAWILGRGLDPAPVRMPGELCIGGAGVARGYLGRPDLTAEKFTPHPFAAAPGARLYRSGDLARRLPDGSIEFLGRVDSQIKVRGFRIEPGEIEAALGTHPQVRGAVVLALDSAPGRKQLVAYLVIESATDPDTAPPDETELRAFLKQRLPDYMVPALFVPLAALPLTPNGKVDRRALPAPDWSRSAVPSEHQPPRTAVEEMLADIWREVLRISVVGAFDDFFAVGGHSLLATQVVARLRAALGIELPLRTLFEAPVLAELAQVVEEQLILQMEEMTDEEAAGLP
jgi:amino acid adenylation domain-containing protein